MFYYSKGFNEKGSLIAIQSRIHSKIFFHYIDYATGVEKSELNTMSIVQLEAGFIPIDPSELPFSPNFDDPLDSPEDCVDFYCNTCENSGWILHLYVASPYFSQCQECDNHYDRSCP